MAEDELDKTDELENLPKPDSVIEYSELEGKLIDKFMKCKNEP